MRKLWIFVFFCICIDLILTLSKNWVKVNTITIKSNKIQRKIRILHISDLHGDSSEKMNIDIWGIIADAKPDLIVMTGDFAVNFIDEFLPHIASISALEAPVFAVEGNHDLLFSDDLKRSLEGAGVTFLSNEVQSISVNGQDIEIIGLRDYYFLKDTEFSGVFELFEQVDKNSFSIVLSHQPQIIEKISRFEPDLVLSGHTHGGQLRLPLVKTIYAPGQGFFPKYGYGLYKVFKTPLFVTKGVGATHFTKRFWNRPEIAIIEIVSK